MIKVDNIKYYWKEERPIFLACTAWLLTLIVFFTQAWPEFRWQGLDYACYYSVGEAIVSGKATTMYNTGEQGPWISYAPFATTSFYYFALVPFKHAKIAFFALKIIAYASWPFLLAAGTGKKTFTGGAFTGGAFAVGFVGAEALFTVTSGLISRILLQKYSYHKQASECSIPQVSPPDTLYFSYMSRQTPQKGM